MKTRALLLPLLLSLLLLAGCRGRESVSGQLVEVQMGADGQLSALVLEEDGKRFGVVLAPESIVSTYWEDYGPEEFLTAPRLGSVLSVTPAKGGRTRMTSQDGRQLRAYTAWHIRVWELREDRDVTLSDGTQVEVWRHRDDLCYRLSDGTQLLWERKNFGPHRVTVGSQERFDDLDDPVRGTILTYYEDQGLLYDPMAQLERAYAAYLDHQGEMPFQNFVVGQERTLVASSPQVLYILNRLTLSVDQSEVTEVTFTDAFCRATGERIPTQELLTCSKEELADGLAAELDGEDPGLAEEVRRSFDWPYVAFHSDCVSADFPAGSVAGREHSLSVRLDYEDLAARGWVAPWAVPVAPRE